MTQSMSGTHSFEDSPLEEFGETAIFPGCYGQIWENTKGGYGRFGV